MSKAVYILASKPKGTLYIGVTSNLKQRIYQHKAHLTDGFTHRYNVCQLVYFELFEDMYHAITREKQLKNWHRKWKINLIEENNPEWLDLYANL
ncbi:excinuclease ABC subunit C [Pseudoalteromonas phenolica]|uniref:Excinuclease ABC subunit C n=1 Tax=Pseudoalteromonas phenolica TaxID=161398 RepID=A0A4Q7ISR5_9GAMM|nr:GIY-YIG nuclease family protein [Pseudoalteromonas phenolica]RZQ55120.1 excinuclease ABC subunit C [Pseudoalteromonas phenolica]